MAIDYTKHITDSRDDKQPVKKKQSANDEQQKASQTNLDNADEKELCSTRECYERVITATARDRDWDED